MFFETKATFPGYEDKTVGFAECRCGAYRPCLRDPEGKVHWTSGCRACDRITFFREGNQLKMNSEVTMDPEKLLARAQREEAEVERLRAGIREALEELSFPAHAAVGDAVEVLKGLLGE